MLRQLDLFGGIPLSMSIYRNLGIVHLLGLIVLFPFKEEDMWFRG